MIADGVQDSFYLCAGIRQTIGINAFAVATLMHVAHPRSQSSIDRAFDLLLRTFPPENQLGNFCERPGCIADHVRAEVVIGGA